MEKVQGKLEVFSAILFQQYIRLLTAAVYHRSDKVERTAKFMVAPDIYAKILQDESQTSLLGLTLVYDDKLQILTVSADDEFCEEFDNNIMRDVALEYAELYKNRYADFISFCEDN